MRPIVDAVPVAVVAVDVHGVVLTWNHAAERLFGWAAADVVGSPLPTVPVEHAARSEWLAGDDVERIAQWVRKDGVSIDVAVRSARLATDDQPGGRVIACRDASPEVETVRRLERRSAELALVRRLASLATRVLEDLDVPRVMAAIVGVGVELADGESGAVSLEVEPGRFERMASVDFPPDLAAEPIVIGEGVHGEVIRTGDALVIDDYDTWPRSSPAFRGRQLHASLGVPIRREGRTIGCLSVHSALPDRRFGPAETQVLTLLADYAATAIGNATAYRRAEADRERFMALLAAMPDGLAVVEDGVVTGWNRAAEALTGIAADRAIGHEPLLSLNDGVVAAPVDDDAAHARWIRTVSSPLPGGHGTIHLLHDVTEQHDLDRAKDLFFATTSHELKTPLTVVKGLASTLREHWSRMRPEQREQALATIERRAESLDRLIERILVGSRVQAGAFAPTLTPTEVRPLVEDVVGGFALASPFHTVRADVAEAVPLVAGDRQALETILGHLVENAIKYSPDGGEVVVQVRTVESSVVVSVLDEGIGIEGDLERLLDPFVQADSRATRRFGGVGLGLYIVARLVAALGGDLWADRRAERGTCVSFSLRTWR